MTIAYENARIVFVTNPQAKACDRPDGYLTLDDSDLDKCFKALRDGSSVWVRTTHGTRHLYHYLMQNYRYVKAAGGVLHTPADQYLMIYRNGRWDLPKGMVERIGAGTPDSGTVEAVRTHEKLREAAAREVTEETGVSPSCVGRLIAKTYHIYDKYGGWHLKQTSWYEMTAPKQDTRPQTEEEITQAVWVPREDCIRRLEGSYASLRLRAEALGIEN